MQKILIVGELKIPYELITSKRKSIGIKVSNEKGVEVRTPKNISKKLLEDVLTSRAPWIQKKIKDVKAKANLKPAHTFKSGEYIPLLGQKYRLHVDKVIEKNEECVKMDESKIYVSVRQEDAPYIKENLIKWYKLIAEQILTKKTIYYSNEMDVSFEKVRINSPSRRWGSCGSNGNINYNWRIILAPVQIIDYLVVHELAHRKEMNHSGKFYAIVSAVLPDYATSQKWLKDNGMYLDI